MKYIKELIENNSNLDQIKEKLNLNTDVIVIDAVILGVPSIIIKRRTNIETIDSIYNNYDFIIISNKLELIITTLPKMITSDSLYNSTKYNLEYNIKDLVIEEFINGEYVIVTKYNNSIMVSTKNNLYATNIIPGTNESYYDCIVKKFEELSLYDIDLLFTKNTENYIWIFNVTNKKEIYLITAYDRTTLKELTKNDILQYAGKFKLKMPKFHSISKISDVDYIKNKFYNDNKNLKGIIYNNIKTGYREKELISNLPQYIYSNSKYILYKITDLILKDKIDIAKHNFNEYTELINLLDLSIKKQYIKIEQVFETIKKFKTKKQIANCLKDFKFSSFIFDNKDSLLINFKHFGDYYKSKKLLKLNYNNQEIDELLTKYIIPTLKDTKINE